MKDQMEKLIADLVANNVFFTDAVSEFEKKYIRRVLEMHRGNQSESAKALGIHRNTLGRKMEEYKLAAKNGHHHAPTSKSRGKK